MKRYLGLALAAFFFVGVFARDVFSQDDPPPVRFAVVDLQKIFDEYYKSDTVTTRIKDQRAAVRKQLDEQLGKIDELTDELGTLGPASPEYQHKVREIELRKLTAKLDRDLALREVERGARREEALIYREIVREAQAFGQDAGYGAVLLFKPIGADLEVSPDLDLVIATRTVLWADSRSDITADVLNILNGSRPR